LNLREKVFLNKSSMSIFVYGRTVRRTRPAIESVVR
jgi:hypothetical protein